MERAAVPLSAVIEDIRAESLYGHHGVRGRLRWILLRVVDDELFCVGRRPLIGRGREVGPQLDQIGAVSRDRAIQELQDPGCCGSRSASMRCQRALVDADTLL